MQKTTKSVTVSVAPSLKRKRRVLVGKAMHLVRLRHRNKEREKTLVSAWKLTIGVEKKISVSSDVRFEVHSLFLPSFLFFHFMSRIAQLG